MSWNAKPSGAYPIGSDEWKENITEIYNLIGSEYTYESISGMLGNWQSESGLNPWRWQNDTVNLTSKTHGYGFPQFTPAYGYINDYGKGVDGYAPNLSVTSVTTGASPMDGKAQTIVVNEDKAGKFINRARYCDFADISTCYPFSAYKQVTDLWIATVGWLYNYEFPAKQYRTYEAAKLRYDNSVAVYNYITGGVEPIPPDPPEPTPIESSGGMKFYMYPHYKMRKQIITTI